jgi:hypothetical protein
VSNLIQVIIHRQGFESGSALGGVAIAFKMRIRIRIQEGKNDSQKLKKVKTKRKEISCLEVLDVLF